MAALLLLGSATACSQNVAEKYWQEKVEKALYGQEYVNVRVLVDKTRLYDGVEFDRQPTDTVEIHFTPRGLYVKDGYCYRLETEDSLFYYDFLNGNYTYGQTKKPESHTEKMLYGQARISDYLEEIIPFYLKPNEKTSFRLKKFRRMESHGDTTMLWYSTLLALEQKFLDGRANEYGENNVAWVDDATGLVTRVRRITREIYEGFAPEDEIVDLRLIDISLEKEDIDERLYRKHPSRDEAIAFYNLNMEECSPSFVHEAGEENLDRFLDAPLVGTTLDTTTLREIEGWVLVDIWQFGCRPCTEFVKNMKQEQDSLGYRVLEHEGITVVCLNPSSLVTEEFKSYAERYNIQDIAYSARTIMSCAMWVCSPYYYLISPAKEVVFRGNDIGKNYGNILKAKKEVTRR